MFLISVTFSCASYISYSTWSKANTLVIRVTAVLLFCYFKLISISKQHILDIHGHQQLMPVPIKVSLYKSRD